MRRLAFLAAAVLAAAAARTARAEPLDVDLSRLGAPDPAVWTSVHQIANPGAPPLSQATADQYARDARQRFAILSTELALALSSAVLHPASTTGHSGFAVDLEVASMAVHPDPIGVATAGFTDQVWPTASTQPTSLLMPSVHMRKAFPFSLEFGGRLIYLSQSNAFAAQGEGKWAINEGFEYVPDIAVRASYTQLFGVKDWNLSATDLDFMVSKRFALMGVTSLTPYVAARYTYVSASTERIDFAPRRSAYPAGNQDLVSTQASFPRFKAGFYRTTLGLRFSVYSVALALEGTYFGGSSPKADGYEGVKIASSFGGAAKLGWQW
jgi:hypothetical protein